jgi:hypothetical protein
LELITRIDHAGRSYTRSVDEEHSIADIYLCGSTDAKCIEDIREICLIQVSISYRRDGTQIEYSTGA